MRLADCRLKSEEDTRELAVELAKKLRGGMLVGLCGELGAGKTTLVRYLCEALKAREPVSSPSYVLEHEYHAASGLLIDHWDLYRLGGVPEELLEPPSKDTVCLVEWIDKQPSLMEQADLLISITFAEDDPLRQQRLVRFVNPQAPTAPQK